MSVKPILFIDANQYLELYLIDSGKKMLRALDEQREYIFVTAQVVDEVDRNKVKIAARFLADTLKKLEVGGVAVPDHLLSTTDSKIGSIGDQLREIRKKVQGTKNEFKKLTPALLEQISQSRDEVSKALAGVFSQAVAPTEGEVQRAKARKERGNPPGKYTDPLGDQLSWEQILSRCHDKPKLWIISRDRDYATEYQGEMFLNAFLYHELAQLYGSAPEVFCFDDIDAGIRHFAATTKVKAEKLPTPEEARQIKEERESLPPGWLANYDDANAVAIQNGYRMAESTLLRAILAGHGTVTGAGQVDSEELVPPPEGNEADR